MKMVTNSDNNDDTDSYNGIQTFKLKDADNLYVADYNGAVHHITTADGKIASSYDDFELGQRYVPLW